MHRHRSSKVLRTLNVSAWQLMLTVVLTVSGICLLGYGILLDLEFWQIVGAGVLGAGVLSLIIFFARSSGMRCPLCMVPLWGNQKCQRNSKAKPALGISYRLGVASSIVFRGHYRCPYCGEPFNAREARK